MAAAYAIGMCPAARAASTPPAAAPPGFSAEARPLLQAYCFSCHSEAKHKGHVNFSLVSDDSAALRQRKLWRKSIEQLEGKQMPPDDADKQPTPQEREKLLAWMKLAAAYVDPNPADRDPGPAVVRRLSLAEYNNSIFEIFGVEFDGGALVGMSDDSGSGNLYGNLAAALDVAPAQMDKYFAAADKVLDRFFETDLSSSFDGAPRDRARAARETLFGFKLGTWREPGQMPKLPEGTSERDAARTIITRVVSRAFRTQATAGDVEPFMALYDHASGKGEGFVNSVRLMMKAVLVSPRFLYRIEADRGSGGSREPYRVTDHELATRLAYFLWSSAPDPQLSEAAEKGLLTSDAPGTEPTQLAGVIIGSKDGNNKENTLVHAFDGDPFTFYEGPDGDGDWAGLDLGEPKKITSIRYAAMHYDPGRVVHGKFQASNSPDFGAGTVDLFEIAKSPERGEIVSHDVSPADKYRYVRFLSAPGGHCSIADLEVWGQTDGTVLEQQVRRMLASPRARALTDNFAAHWLELNRLPTARPSTEFFPDFQPDIRQAMYDETSMFFDGLRTGNRSILELIDANYTYLNEDLAKYYKIPDVTGKQMRKVELKPEYHRGGLLGMGSVLAVTSHTYRTSPTLRGKYVLDVIFGTPPPPPPANAGMFKDEKKVKEAKNFRELLANHASDATCAACHRKLDPLGFALENFNAAGIWRDDDHGQALDTSGVLPSGEKINGVGELKQVILRRKDDFARNVAEQMLIYALGRDLDDYDDSTVRQITEDLARNDYRFSTLVMDVVKSYPFEYRRNSEGVQ